MKKYLCALAVSISSMMIASNANAVLVSTNGSLSSANVAASIITAPADVRDDAATNQAIQAFDEVVGFELLAALNVDGGTIAAGTHASIAI